MTSTSDLVVTADESVALTEAKNAANPFSGAGGVENVYGATQALTNGDWDTAGLSALGVGLDAVGFAADPLGSLASWGVGWLIENVSFLREPFDALMGNPDAISGMASTWENIGEELKSVAQGYGQSAQSTTAWEGRSGNAYRALGAETAKTLDAVGETCHGMKAAVEGAGTVVGAVRGIVRDLIAGAIGEIVSAVLKWGIAAACTAGIAAGGLIADAIRIALKWADKISGWMTKLADALKSLSSCLDKLGSAGQSLKTKVDDFFAGLANPPSGNLVNVRTQPALSGNHLDSVGTGAQTEGASAFQDAWSGFKAGGAEYKPFTSGEIWSPHLDMGPDGGRAKMTYEVVKETAKLDDGADSTAEDQEKK
ncbi:WXG100 family type VII secretion target [Saccharopolyspora sp. CA-218241]|uniref:WXG100 family type VII secretion target n=1 Tax=Saccharopolyspora sp. CA-218241 TaxID=3240027 RepID=UPI003D96B267